MREALITVPQFDNDGASLEPILNDVMMQLVEAFGGCTVVAARGAWKGPDGKLYAEPVNQVISAVEPSAETDATLRRIAIAAGEAGEQLAMYVRFSDASVEIVKIESVCAKLAA